MIKIEKMDDFTLNRKYPPTPPQWQAISLTGTDVLVAAAAGSGKTEVLSERIARKIALERWDIDKVLVLTFTTAAAKNMLVRIENKISERLLYTNSEEDRRYLRKQRMLMNDAYVSTIDSFCLSILKKFYYLVEEEIDGEKIYLSPNFSVLPNSKNLLIESIGQVLEYYANQNTNFTDSLFTILGDRKNIIFSIQETYQKLLTIPNFENYMENNFLLNTKKVLSLFNFDDFYDLLEKFNSLENLTTKNSLQIAKDFSEFLRGFIKNYNVEGIIEKIFEESNLDSVRKKKVKSFLVGYEENSIFGSSLEKISQLDNIILKLNEVIGSEKNIFDTKVLNDIFSELTSYAEIFSIVFNLNNFIEAYKEVLKKSHFEFLKKKRQNNFLDFSDLNHLAIKALTKFEDGEIVLTEAAEYYRNYFLEIYVDEYQDNNNLQEYILNLIKGEEVHFFRVGDVKQAIYGFRGSNPDLFEKKYNSYENLGIENYNPLENYNFEVKSKGICIVLKENFRSEENILKSSNYIFNRLMNNKNAGVSYSEESALYYPSVKKKNTKIRPTQFISGEINYFTNEKILNTKDYRVQSIENIVYEILRGVGEGRNYSDYAILVRNSTKMQDFKKVFSKYNIPLFFKEKIGFTNSMCFNILYNLFRFLDNTNRDSSLLALLHSEIFDYSNDELLKLSLCTGENLLEKLKNSEDGKDLATVNILNKWLNFSLNNSLRDLLGKIVDDTDFVNYLSTIDISDEEVDYYENFVDIVEEYQNIDNKLSNFVEYLKDIKNEEIFETKKRIPNNSVTLSTIHISKGLEYKFVFVADLDTKFSSRGYSGEILFTEEFGFSVNVENLCEKYNISMINSNYLSKLYNLNSILIKLKEREEEIRNLYVALTRAEKGLYLVSPKGINLNNEKSREESLQKTILEARNFEEILNVVLCFYSDGAEHENEHNAEFEIYEVLHEEVKLLKDKNNFNLENFCKEFNKKEKRETGDKERIVLKKNKIFPAKTSYSALKKINEELLIKEKQGADKKNYLELSNLNKVTSTSKAIMKGNIIHKLFERIVFDVKQGVEISDMDSYLSNLEKTQSTTKNIGEQRILTNEEYQLINNEDDKEKINNFLRSDVLKMIKSSKNCQTEIAFTTSKKAYELYKQSDSDVEVILQGVVDLLISVSDKEYVIVDYKTDNVPKNSGEKILKEKHSEQLRIYKEAVEKYYGLNNVKTYIYSYTLSKLIEIKH
ncbi:UvrD-helicase domain-containing protein [Gemella cuniculi]|uniref:UvrD-helicase domain-containing protein n=1 Tax=Gemella cuniculi TaxID=150240 RepID=UPI0004283F63|nr:UvrD-helicase domain-containing protein [Gemella cuniculi]